MLLNRHNSSKPKLSQKKKKNEREVLNERYTSETSRKELTHGEDRLRTYTVLRDFNERTTRSRIRDL